MTGSEFSIKTNIHDCGIDYHCTIRVVAVSYTPGKYQTYKYVGLILQYDLTVFENLVHTGVKP